MPIVKIKIYSLNGTTLFSTDATQVGEAEDENAGYLSARTGGTASLLSYSNTHNAFDNEIVGRDVLGTYIPIYDKSESGQVIGVFELYSDVTFLVERVNVTERNVILGVFGILAALYAALFLIVRHADGVMRRQRVAHEQAETALRREQQAMAAMQEREQLARELHDSVGQVLGYVNTQTQAARARLAQGDMSAADALLSRLVEVACNAHTDVRGQILLLRSNVVEHQDFAALIQMMTPRLAQECSVEVELNGLDQLADGRCKPVVVTQLVRIVQEALTNIRKYAQARHVQISLACLNNGDCARLTITDDGNGFIIQSKRDEDKHFGLQIMKDRAAEIGGSFQIVSSPGQGCRVAIEFPLNDGVISDSDCDSVSNKESSTYESIVGRRSSTFFRRATEFMPRAKYSGSRYSP